MMAGRLGALVLVLAACSGEPTTTALTPPAAAWSPAPGTTWQWQLSGAIDTSFDVEMYDVDLFDVAPETIAHLQADGRVVVCYFSAGSFEEWRPDAAAFPEDVIGSPLEEWPGERWLDIRDLAALGPIVGQRLDLAVAKGCDGVEPDNVDGFDNATGFEIDPGDQLTFNRWLADEAHSRGLSIGLKNDLGQILDLVNDFDWLLVEQCFEFDECSETAPFVAAGKAVFVAEYTSVNALDCAIAGDLGLALIFKDLDLTAPLITCD